MGVKKNMKLVPSLILKQILAKLCTIADGDANTEILECFAEVKALLTEIRDQPDYESVKTGWYCPEGEDATWLCDFIFLQDGVEVNRITEDSGIPCTEEKPQDVEIKQVKTCVDGFEQVQFCYIAFIDGVPGENVNIGDPITTQIECNVKAAIGVNKVCFLSTEIVKTGTQVSDFDPGDLEVGDEACVNFSVTVAGGSQSVTMTPIAGYVFTETGYDAATGQRFFQACWTYDGTTPNDALTANVVNMNGGTAAVTSGDFFIGSGGGESLAQEYSVKLYLKEICYDGKPNVYQDNDGNVVDATELTPCPEDPTPPVLSYDYEFECVDGSLAIITTTTTDGVAATSAPVAMVPAVDCTNADDFELVKACDPSGFYIIYAYDKSDLAAPVGQTLTTESCSVCQEFETKTVWKLTGGAPGVNGSRWRENSAVHGPVDTMFDGCGNHTNGAADEIVVYPNWNVVDTPARFPLTGADFGTSQEYYWSYVYFPQGVILNDNNANTGEFIAAYVGGKDQKPVFQKSVGNTGGAVPRGLGDIGYYAAGLYKVAVELSDFSVYGGVNIRQSVDGGSTFTAIPEANIFSKPPTIECITVRINCDGTQTLEDGTTPFVFDPVTCSNKEIACPVLEADPANPIPDYEFDFTDGCDDVDGDPANYVNITREIVVVDGVQTVTFFTDYGLNTQTVYAPADGIFFVDCATGEPLGEPVVKPTCYDAETIDAFAPTGTQGVNEERWIGDDAVTGLPVSTLPSQIFTGAEDYSLMPAHTNGAPTSAVVGPDFLVNDTNNAQDQFRAWSYIYTPVPIRLRDRAAWAESTRYFLGECCGPVVEVLEVPYPGTSQAALLDVTLPAGIHYVGVQVFDFSAYSGVDLQYSVNGGVTWARVPKAWLYAQKPTLQTCPVRVCFKEDGTSVLTDLLTGDPLGPEFTVKKPNLCTPIAVQSSTPSLSCKTFYRVNKPTQGTVEQQWTVSTPTLTGVNGVSDYLEAFSDTDAEGYPSAPVAPDSTTSNTIASTTNIVSATGEQDAAQSDFYIFLDQDTELREFNGTAEAAAVWISGCGTMAMTEVLNAPYTNITPPNLLGLYKKGCYRVRLYHTDFSANGVARLQGMINGAWSNLPAYPTKPTVDVIEGWKSSDGNNYNQDLSEVLEGVVCEDPRCMACCDSGGSSEPLPLAIGRA